MDTLSKLPITFWWALDLACVLETSPWNSKSYGVRESFPKKKELSIWTLSKWGGSLPNFFWHIFISAFLVIKRSLYSIYLYANNLNFKLFFMLYTWPTKQVFCLYLRRILDNKSFWMSLKLTFLALKKSGTSCPKWGVGGRGGRGNLDNIQKNIYFFSWDLP